MTTATTATVVDITTDAGFRVACAEIIVILFTTLGLTQTADTGQINTATVTRSGSTNTSVGYVIGRFNDTAQSTSPIFFKLEFGTGATATTSVQLWITVGTGSNGSGTITGVVTARCGAGAATPNSNITAYTTRACYNTTDGVLWLGWKYNSTALAPNNVALAGFLIARSNDNTGAVTTDAVLLLTNVGTAVNSQTQQASVQVISYLTSTIYGASSPWSSNGQAMWGLVPFSLTSTLVSSNAYVGPCFQYTPVPGISNWYGLVLIAELAVGSTISTTLVGSTSHTYIQGGCFCGTVNLTFLNITDSTIGVLLPWE
jgi:hypothetical protein